MTVGQKWSTVAKAFTLKDLSLEEKEKLFETQKADDSSDTAKRFRHLCDALKSTEEEFEQIYESFREKESKHSVTLKTSIAQGWNHPYHKERLLKYRDRYFKDTQDLVDQLESDHHHAFYTHLAPIDDDLEYQIEQYEKIKLPVGKEKNSTDILKMVDTLKRRAKAYELYKSL
jgi:hypothetical protein